MIARAEAVAALEEERFDVLVIGGGITGAGVALDAASRGYSVALVERDDWAAGTSSRSSKLVHGGLRYLQSFDIGLVREALLERSLMVQLAPHLVTPLPMLVPAFDDKRPDRALGVALNLYDGLASRPLRRRRERRAAADEGIALPEETWSPARHRTVDGDEALALLPALSSRPPTSGYLFYDCQTDDVRLVLTVLGEAERFGAVLANRLGVEELLEQDGRACGARCRDGLGGGMVEVRAEHVVSATGVWADRIRPDELYGDEELPRLRPSRGTHVLLADADLPLEAGAIVPAGGGRSIFALPWLGRALVGTTDNDYEGPLDHIRPDPADIAYLLDACNAFFRLSLTLADLCGAYAGVRPLIQSEKKKSVDISRRAELYETRSGLVTITGGKLTTWRRMAKLAVDRLVERDGREAACRTAEIPLGQPATPDLLAPSNGVSEESRVHLAARYGYAARDVLALAAERPGLSAPAVRGRPDLLAEAPFAVRREQAASLADVLMRRTRLALLDAPALCGEDAAAPRAVARAMAPELDWDAARVEAELAAWRETAAAEGIDMRAAEPPAPAAAAPAAA